MRFATRSKRSTATKPHSIESFERLSLEHLEGLYNFALHQTLDTSTAETLVVTTYVRARSQFERLSAGTGFKPWIFKVLRSTAIDERKNGPSNGVALPQNGEIDPELAVLPELQRLVVVLFAVEGFSYREIADILSTRPDDVFVWLDTALRWLDLRQGHQLS